MFVVETGCAGEVVVKVGGRLKTQLTHYTTAGSPTSEWLHDTVGMVVVMQTKKSHRKPWLGRTERKTSAKITKTLA